MTQPIINDILPLTQIVATAGQEVFSTNWTANAASDVVVYYTPVGQPANDVTQIITQNQYSVDFIGGLETVQVTLVTPAVNTGDMVTITRQTPADRENLYSNTNFTPSMLNNDFEILTLVDQQAQLVNQQVAPRYNYSALVNIPLDTILPILGANQLWVKNANNTAFTFATLGTSAAINATNPALPYVASTNGMFTVGHVLIAGDTLGTVADSGSFAGTGSVTSVDSGTGLTGGPITESGTLSLAPIEALGILSNVTNAPAAPIPNTLTQILDASFSTAQGSILYRDAAEWMALAPGTNGEFLQTQGAAQNPIWATSPGSGTVSSGLINEMAWYNANGNTIVGLTTANSGILGTSAGGVPSIMTTLPFTLSVAKGGTGKTAVPIAPAATTYAGWDANNNLSANNFLSGYISTVTSSTPVVLTVGSAYQQYFTGSTAQTVTMPVASTVVLGQGWYFANNSSANLTINSSGGNLITTVGALSETYVTCILNSGTTAASWTTTAPVSGSGTVSPGSANQLGFYATSGSVISGLTLGTNLSISGTTLNVKGTYLGTRVITTTGANVFTPTAAANTFTLYLGGGGGSGGGVTGAGGTGASSGGTAGAELKASLTRAQLLGSGTTATITIGSGAAAPTAGANNGLTGGNSSIVQTTGSVTIATAAGGPGGIAATASAVNPASTGPGSASAANVSIGTTIYTRTGQQGGPGLSSGSVIWGWGGKGGDGIFGCGGPVLVSSGANGNNANGFCGAGSGAYISTSTNFTGGTGFQGYGFVDEYT